MMILPLLMMTSLRPIKFHSINQRMVNHDNKNM
jgi:hypothetical protein